MKTSTLIRVALVAVTGLALSACGGGGGGNGSAAVAPPVTVPSLESQFGTGFNTDFFASAMSTPAVPMAGDIIALSTTTNPVQLH